MAIQRYQRSCHLHRRYLYCQRTRSKFHLDQSQSQKLQMMRRKMVRPKSLPLNRVLHLVCTLEAYKGTINEYISQRRMKAKLELLNLTLQLIAQMNRK